MRIIIGVLNFSGDSNVLRVIFSTKNPIHTLHLLKTEIPYETMLEYVEYLDVYESIKDQQNKEMQQEAERARAASNRGMIL